MRLIDVLGVLGVGNNIIPLLTVIGAFNLINQFSRYSRNLLAFKMIKDLLPDMMWARKAKFCFQGSGRRMKSNLRSARRRRRELNKLKDDIFQETPTIESIKESCR